MGKNPKSATERFVPLGEDKLARMSVQLRRVNGVSSVPVVASAPAAPMAQRGSGCRAGALATPSLPSRWAQLGPAAGHCPSYSAGEGCSRFLYHQVFKSEI